MLIQQTHEPRLLPLAQGGGEAGREVQGPMAIVILGGLITSTIVSVVLAPPLILAYRRKRFTEI